MEKIINYFQNKDRGENHGDEFCENKLNIFLKKEVMFNVLNEITGSFLVSVPAEITLSFGDERDP